MQVEEYLNLSKAEVDHLLRGCYALSPTLVDPNDKARNAYLTSFLEQFYRSWPYVPRRP